jgi:hypothetical protein
MLQRLADKPSLLINSKPKQVQPSTRSRWSKI